MILHTVRKGHYVRTLRPPMETPCAPGCTIEVNQLVLSDVGQIVLYCTQHQPGKSKKDVSTKYTVYHEIK